MTGSRSSPLFNRQVSMMKPFLIIISNSVSQIHVLPIKPQESGYTIYNAPIKKRVLDRSVIVLGAFCFDCIRMYIL
jgi:hypothetical protein